MSVFPVFCCRCGVSSLVTAESGKFADTEHENQIFAARVELRTVIRKNGNPPKQYSFIQYDYLIFNYWNNQLKLSPCVQVSLCLYL